MEQFEHAITETFSLVWEMLASLLAVIPTILKFVLWAVAAVFILPCVFVANTLYPLWVKLGEDF